MFMYTNVFEIYREFNLLFIYRTKCLTFGLMPKPSSGVNSINNNDRTV